MTLKALLTTKDDEKMSTDLVELEERDLMSGDVTIAVDYSTVNHSGRRVHNPGMVSRVWRLPGYLGGLRGTPQLAHRRGCGIRRELAIPAAQSSLPLQSVFLASLRAQKHLLAESMPEAPRPA